MSDYMGHVSDMLLWAPNTWKGCFIQSFTMRMINVPDKDTHVRPQVSEIDFVLHSSFILQHCLPKNRH